MIVSKDTLKSVHLETEIRRYINGFHLDRQEFFGVPGQQHYRLLAYLSMQLSGQSIIDIGTHMGSSALALAVNPAVTIHSFDIHRKVPLRDLDNVNFEIADLWDPIVREHWKDKVLGSAMIVLDVDPHNGQMETEFINWLRSEGYKGLVICDDIWYFKEMRDNFWFHIPSNEKLDITPLGHWSGTGVISFVPRTDIQWETALGLKAIGELPGASSPWTVVTAYFDLTKMPDASPAIKARSDKYYLEHARATLALDQPMIVFCEEENVERIRALRPAHLQHKLRIINVDFEKLPLTKYRDLILENRIKNPYRGDERNTASYYLLCMARYGLLKAVMDLNPFQSTHFAWLNICIERMGHTNVMHLEQTFCQSPPRDKVSTVYIDYIPKSLIANTRQYYEFGRCSLCSGFFTGSKANLYEFCNKIEEKFLHYVGLGFGHADEQLYSPVYFENPHLFETYYGDYQQMITNYSGCYENAGMPLHLVIPKSYAAKDWKTCESACHWLWDSYQKGIYKPSQQDLVSLLTYSVATAFESGSAAIQAVRASGALDAFYVNCLQ